MEDFLKSVRKTTSSKDDISEEIKFVHEPIDWSKYPPSALPNNNNAAILPPSDAIEEELNEKEEEEEEYDFNICLQNAAIYQKVHRQSTNRNSFVTHLKQKRQQKQQLYTMHDQMTFNNRESIECSSFANHFQSNDRCREKQSRFSLNYASAVDSLKSKLSVNHSEGCQESSNPSSSTNPKTSSRIFMMPTGIDNDNKQRSSFRQRQQPRFQDRFFPPQNSTEQYKKQRSSTSTFDFARFAGESRSENLHEQSKRQRHCSTSFVDFTKFTQDLRSSSSTSQRVRRRSNKANYKKTS